MKSTITALTMAFIALTVSPAFAVAPKAEPGTNFTSEYPADTCKKPYKPSNFRSQSESEDFDNDVEKYQNCVQEYLTNASNDIARIKAKGAAALQKSRAPY